MNESSSECNEVEGSPLLDAGKGAVKITGHVEFDPANGCNGAIARIVETVPHETMRIVSERRFVEPPKHEGVQLSNHDAAIAWVMKQPRVQYIEVTGTYPVDLEPWATIARQTVFDSPKKRS